MTANETLKWIGISMQSEIRPLSMWYREDATVIFECDGEEILELPLHKYEELTANEIVELINRSKR